MANTNTPLHLAVQNGNIEIIKTLLASGGDLDARNADGLTPLDLAITTNNAEIVQLLLEHKNRVKVSTPPAFSFPAPPSAPIPLTAEQRKQRITFWTTLCTVSLVLLVLVVLTKGFMELRAYNDSSLTFDELDALLYKILRPTRIFFLLALLASSCCYFFFILRIWEEIPCECARMTPKKAAWLSLIPYFAYYWMFVVLLGLHKDMNKLMKSYGQGTRFSTALIAAACTGWLFFGVHFEVFNPLIMFFVEDSPGETLREILWWITYCIFTVSMYWVIRKNVLDFIEIKENAEQSIGGNIEPRPTATVPSIPASVISVLALIAFIGVFCFVHFLLNGAGEMAQLRNEAERGSADAQFDLGLRYLDGEGVSEDKTEAVRWFRIAAEQGHAGAQFDLALCYFDGSGVPENKSEAAKWYRLAAEQGHAEAQNNLGILYTDGEGVTKDYEEAVKWFRKSAEQGNALAQCNLAGCYFFGDGVPENKTEAVKWYRKAAEQGDDDAIELLKEIESVDDVVLDNQREEKQPQKTLDDFRLKLDANDSRTRAYREVLESSQIFVSPKKN